MLQSFVSAYFKTLNVKEQSIESEHRVKSEHLESQIDSRMMKTAKLTDEPKLRNEKFKKKSVKEFVLSSELNSSKHVTYDADL